MKNIKKGVFLGVIALLITACSTAPKGNKVKTSPEKEVTKASTIKEEGLLVDVEKSLVNWVGSKPGGEHTGELKIKEGRLKVEEGNLVGGAFILDMTSINVTDLSGAMKSKLEGHLKTRDFFEVEKYPDGKFEITKVIASESNENATHIISGNLTLLAITKSVELPAKIVIEGDKVTATAPQFLIDRTEWGIVYKSSKLGNAAINDNIGIAINLETK